MQHKPTPWHVHGQPWKPQEGADDVVSIAWNKDGELVAESVYAENADFIVRACNAHDELVAALDSFPVHMMMGHADDEVAKAVIKWLPKRVAALAKAEGK